MMVILCKSPTGNSGQMLCLYYSRMIINFIEVAIKERKEEWIACRTLTCPLLNLRGRKEMASPLDKTVRTEWPRHYYIHRGNISDHLEYHCGFFLIQPSNGNTLNQLCILMVSSIYNAVKNLVCTMQRWAVIKPTKSRIFSAINKGYKMKNIFSFATGKLTHFALSVSLPLNALNRFMWPLRWKTQAAELPV